MLLRYNDASLQNELLEVIKSHGLIGLIQMEDIILAEPEIEIGATFAVPQTSTLQSIYVNMMYKSPFENGLS